MALSILHRHLYRTPKVEDEDRPAFTIPCSMIRQVIDAHEDRQSRCDNSKNNKRPREEINLTNQRNTKILVDRIRRRKKPRVVDSESDV
jgi:hypothetical protein